MDEQRNGMSLSLIRGQDKYKESGTVFVTDPKGEWQRPLSATCMELLNRTSGISPRRTF